MNEGPTFACFLTLPDLFTLHTVCQVRHHAVRLLERGVMSRHHQILQNLEDESQQAIT